MLGSVPVPQLKRTAKALGLDVPSGTEKADLVEAVGKKARAGAGFFLIDPKCVGFSVGTTLPELSPDQLAAGYALHLMLAKSWNEEVAGRDGGDRERYMACKDMSAAELRASTDPEVVRLLGEYEKALKACVESDVHSEVVKRQATIGYGGTIASVEVEALSVGERDAREDEVFFVGPGLWLECADKDELVSVPLDEAGVCTLGAFARSVAETKIGSEDNSHCFFECAGHAEDEDGTTVGVGWGS